MLILFNYLVCIGPVLSIAVIRLNEKQSILLFKMECRSWYGITMGTGPEWSYWAGSFHFGFHSSLDFILFLFIFPIPLLLFLSLISNEPTSYQYWLKEPMIVINHWLHPLNMEKKNIINYEAECPTDLLPFEIYCKGMGFNGPDSLQHLVRWFNMFCLQS